MATKISNQPKNKSVFQAFPDLLKDTWKSDEARNWNIYFQEQQFSYFWDTRKEAQK